MISDICPPLKPLLTKTKLLRPPLPCETASAKDRTEYGDPTPNSLGGTKKFFAYAMKKKKMIGAKNARTSVLNQFLQNTMRSVFSTRAYHWRKKAMILVGGDVRREQCLASSYVDGFRWCCLDCCRRKGANHSYSPVVQMSKSPAQLVPNSKRSRMRQWCKCSNTRHESKCMSRY